MVGDCKRSSGSAGALRLDKQVVVNALINSIPVRVSQCSVYSVK
jgi:hypothetical protein